MWHSIMAGVKYNFIYIVLRPFFIKNKTTFQKLFLKHSNNRCVI